MPIQGFGQYSRLHNEYYEKDIAKAAPKTVRNDQSVEDVGNPKDLLSDSTAPAMQAQENRTNTIDLENISLTFQKEDSFAYIGSDRELANLDVQKAVSDMKRDDVLAEYQYFVGSKEVPDPVQREDGIVVPKWYI